jgi:flavin-dependent dehydrogenase
MITDARTLADGATLEADVCIAGAGAAGMTIALDLRASGLSVLLLESGGAERDPEVQSLSEGRMTGIDTWNVRAMRIRALGGTTGIGRLVPSAHPAGFRSARLHFAERLADQVFRSGSVLPPRV